jgi:hypothetical protein
MAKLSTTLQCWARLSRDVEAYSSGDPQKISRRWANKLKGRALFGALRRLGYWSKPPK